jgi:hypothetical protein
MVAEKIWLLCLCGLAKIRNVASRSHFPGSSFSNHQPQPRHRTVTPH